MNVISRTRIRYYRARHRIRVVNAALHGRSVMYKVRLTPAGVTFLTDGGIVGDCHMTGFVGGFEFGCGNTAGHRVDRRRPMGGVTITNNTASGE